MGKKGEKGTNDSVIAAEYMLKELSNIEGVSFKKMFGGHGFFHEEKMFGMVTAKGVCCLKVSDSNREDFEARGSEKMGRMPYYQIPEEVLENQEKLLTWARKAIAITKK